MSVVVVNLVMENIEERALSTFHTPPRVEWTDAVLGCALDEGRRWYCQHVISNNQYHLILVVLASLFQPLDVSESVGCTCLEGFGGLVVQNSTLVDLVFTLILYSVTNKLHCGPEQWILCSHFLQ